MRNQKCNLSVEEQVLKFYSRIFIQHYLIEGFMNVIYILHAFCHVQKWREEEGWFGTWPAPS